MHRFVERTEVFRKLQRRTGPVVLAVSGGGDSSAMLHLFHQLYQCGDVLFEPVVAHVQHDLREEGPEADRDFVRSRAQEYGLQFSYRTVRVRGDTDRGSSSPEAAARKKRYAALADICVEVGSGTVLTAHHRGDQIQTILMRLCGGTGLQGLCGIRASRPFGAHESHGQSPDDTKAESRHGDRLQLVRPLLEVPQESIEAYLEEHDLSWRKDPSNQDLQYRRNQVRERLVPRVQTMLGEDYPDRLLRIQRHATAIDQSLRSSWSSTSINMKQKHCRLMVNRSDVESCERMLYPYLLRRMKRECALPESIRFHDVQRFQKLIQSGETGREEVLTGDLTVRLEHDYLVAWRPAPGEGRETPDPVFLKVPGSVDWGTYSLTCVPADSTALDQEGRSDPWRERVDVSRIHGALHITTRDRGDVIRPLGMSGHKTLKELMIDQKLSRSLRDQWPVLRDAQGVVWVPGLRLADRAGLTDRSRPKQVFEFTCTREEAHDDRAMTP